MIMVKRAEHPSVSTQKPWATNQPKPVTGCHRNPACHMYILQQLAYLQMGKHYHTFKGQRPTPE